MTNNIYPVTNTPDVWKHHFPWPHNEGNKYDRGHAVIVGGEWQSTGATKLAAQAALRIGAGLVSVVCDTRSLPLYADTFRAVMTKLSDTLDDYVGIINDKRVKAVLIGPGAGVTEHTKTYVLEALLALKPMVLDADALSIFAKEPQSLFDAIKSPCILTPHEGEFKRLFGSLVNEKEEALNRAIYTASLSGAVIILKGFHTIIAAPDGKAAINTNATPFLATAGSGDVLAGLCTGLLAQGMPAFEAACAAVWFHAEAGRRFGAGLTSEDIADQLPPILQEDYGLWQSVQENAL
jgi:hydroxyethylthiazole kinase-like uncharacterized protein yjeF